jgi:hypothetical protein
MRAVQRSFSLTMSTLVLGIMLNTYITYMKNKTTQSSGQTVALYPINPVTWPTYMMIATSSVSLFFNALIMAGYACGGTKKANTMSMYSGYWGYLVYIINFGVWLATMTTFKMMQGDAGEVPPPSDLWGWTCSDAVDELVHKINSPVDFDLQCTTQVCV